MCKFNAELFLNISKTTHCKLDLLLLRSTRDMIWDEGYFSTQIYEKYQSEVYFLHISKLQNMLFKRYYVFFCQIATDSCKDIYCGITENSR